MTTACLTRRGVLAGLATLPVAALPASAWAQTQSGARTFRVLRDGSDIGRHHLEARLTSTGFEIDINIDLRVSLLGFTAYRYTLENREIWEGRQILSVDSQGNDDGDRFRVGIRRAEAGLEVDGSGYSGSEPLEAVTTSYFAPAFLDRRPWISTQSGRPLDIRVGPREGAEVAVRGDLETVLRYSGGEWTGSEFTARGSRITYQTIESTGAIAPLWERA